MGIELGGLFMAIFDYQRLSYWTMNSFLPATPHQLEAIHLDFYSSWRSQEGNFKVALTQSNMFANPIFYLLHDDSLYIYSLYTILYIYSLYTILNIYIYIILYIYHIIYIYTILLYTYIIYIHMYYILLYAYIYIHIYIYYIYIYHSSNPSSAPAPEPRWQWSAPRWCSRPDQRSQAVSAVDPWPLVISHGNRTLSKHISGQIIIFH